MAELTKRTFYAFEDFEANPPSRQVRRWVERRKDRMPVTVNAGTWRKRKEVRVA